MGRERSSPARLLPLEAQRVSMDPLAKAEKPSKLHTEKTTELRECARATSTEVTPASAIHSTFELGSRL